MAGRVRAEPDAMSQHVPGEILDVVWIDFVPPSPKKGPDLDEASPADGGARRGAEVHVFFDQIRWRMMMPSGLRLKGSCRHDQPSDVLLESLVHVDFASDDPAQRDDSIFGYQRRQLHILEIEAHQLLLFFRPQVRDVHDDREAINGGLGERKGALAQLGWIHRGDGEAERRQFVGELADRDRTLLKPFEERTLRLERDTVNLVEQDDFRGGQRAKLGDEGTGRRIDHLKT